LIFIDIPLSSPFLIIKNPFQTKIAVIPLDKMGFAIKIFILECKTS